MDKRVIFSAITALLVAGATACGGRTAAATQKTPAAFDPAASDAQAIAAVDEMMTALGGAEAWSQVKQLRWELKYTTGGTLTGWFRHAWDIWNGRHRYEFADVSTVGKTDENGRPVPVLFTIAMYELFDHDGKGFVSNSLRPTERAMTADRDRIVKQSYEAWKRDSYQLAMFFKLRDPGVQLKYAGERNDLEGLCKPGCVDIKVSFVPEVGADTYHVLINKETKLPEVVEKLIPGGNLSFGITEWQEVNGLKFPAVLKNMGPDEVFRIENVQIGAPDDSLYVPQVIG